MARKTIQPSPVQGPAMGPLCAALSGGIGGHAHTPAGMHVTLVRTSWILLV